jgi:hypothetical protein
MLLLAGSVLPREMAMKARCWVVVRGDYDWEVKKYESIWWQC